MIEGIQLKVCGLTSLADAQAAESAGGDYLGFNLYPQSPRFISPEKFRSLEPRLPKGKRVAVMVEPAAADLDQALRDGFDFFQIHFRHDLPQAQLEFWSKIIGPDRLWLAPKLPPAVDVPPAWLPLAGSFFLDTFAPDLFGGSGRTGDWAKFSRHRSSHPDKRWILAGGLNPSNIADALRQSGARFVDVNSGIESAPGMKDHAKLKAFAGAVRSMSLIK